MNKATNQDFIDMYIDLLDTIQRESGLSTGAIAKALDIGYTTFVGITQEKRALHTPTMKKIIKNIKKICPQGLETPITTATGEITTYGKILQSVAQNTLPLPATTNLGEIIKSLQAEMGVSKNIFCHIVGIQYASYYTILKTTIIHQGVLNKIMVKLKEHSPELYEKYAPQLEEIKPHLPKTRGQQYAIIKNSNLMEMLEQEKPTKEPPPPSNDAPHIDVTNMDATIPTTINLGDRYRLSKRYNLKTARHLSQAEEEFKAAATKLFNHILVEVAENMDTATPDKNRALLHYLCQNAQIEIFTDHPGRKILTRVSEGDPTLPIETYRLALYEIAQRRGNAMAPYIDTLLSVGGNIIAAQDELHR